MAPKRKGGSNKQADKQSPQTEPTNQSAPVITPAPGRPAPRDRSAPSNDASLQLSPGTTNMVAGSANSADLLDAEMDRLGVEIEAAERTQKVLAEQHEASVASVRKKRDRLQLLLDASSVVAQGVTLAGTRAPVQSAPARTPASAESTRSPEEVEAIRRSVDTAAADEERAKRLNQVLNMPAPIGPASDVPTVEPTTRKRSRVTQVVHPWETPTYPASYSSVMSADLARRSPGAFDDDVEFTGRSQALPSPAEVQFLTATYVRSHVGFAETSPEYDAMPVVPGGQAAANALIANLRLALQNHRPAP